MVDDAVGAKRDAGAGWVIAYTAVVVAMMSLQMSSLGFSPLLPSIQKEFHMSFSQLGTFTGIYGLVANRLPVHSSIAKGALFGIAAWLVMMVVFMPLAGAGLFALGRGTINVALMALVMHLVFGSALGKLYDMTGGFDAARSGRHHA